MAEEVITVVKVPISEIEKWMRGKHALPKVLTDFRIEESTLVLYFSDEETFQKESLSDRQLAPSRAKRRRARRKRNRMRTRGWEAIGRIINSKGQKCAIYKPFVDALGDPKLTTEEQKKVVERILRSNRNRPTEASIQYFLENTLEYLQKRQEQTSEIKVA